MANNPREEAYKVALAQIQKQFGEGSIMNLSDAHRVKVDTIPTGSIGLDIALGGGIPKGRIVEIYGPESSGKTTLTLHIATECQKMGGRVAFIDAEHALDPEYAEKIGLDLKRCSISQPDSGEEALEVAEILVRSGAVDLVIVDSVAALTPKAEIQGMMGDSHMGLQARLMSQALRKLTAAVSKSKCTIIFINQIRHKIGVFFGNPETTTGGNALKFYASVRIDIRKIDKIESGTGDNKEMTGSRTRVKVVKNKIAPPFKIAEFDIMFHEGISRIGDLIDTGIKLDIIKKAGAFFSFGDHKWQGREKVKEFLQAHADIAQTIDRLVRTKAFGKELMEEGKTAEKAA